MIASRLPPVARQACCASTRLRQAARCSVFAQQGARARLLCTMHDDKSAYDTLGVSRSASGAEIRAKYLGLAKATHPDAGGQEGDGFARISAAYD